MGRKNKERFLGQSQPQPAMNVVANGGVNDAVNFATEDFYKAARILARCTNEFAAPYETLKPGLQSFVTQQFFRMNAAGQILDALGYQGVTEVLAVSYAPAVTYINQTMAMWNKVITDEGEVEKIWKALEAEESAQGIQKMQ